MIFATKVIKVPVVKTSHFNIHLKCDDASHAIKMYRVRIFS
jgi:hypothetical protein